VLLSGNDDAKRILVFNWTTMAYTLQASHLSGDRSNGACAILKGFNGETWVAIAGGRLAGIEVWNPADGSVTTLNSTFPLADAQNPGMIAVNGNTELILYESSSSVDNPKGIWKFSQVTNLWTKIGEMMTEKSSFSALAVDGIICPSPNTNLVF
jgi:hypothetical protein